MTVTVTRQFYFLLLIFRVPKLQLQGRPPCHLCCSSKRRWRCPHAFVEMFKSSPSTHYPNTEIVIPLSCHCHASTPCSQICEWPRHLQSSGLRTVTNSPLLGNHPAPCFCFCTSASLVFTLEETPRIFRYFLQCVHSPLFLAK
jgi:hypothetical protein